MDRIAVVYWSGTGNTLAMAEAVAAGAKAAGAEITLFSVGETDAQAAAASDKLAFGCPAMGAEVLEETEFEPFFTALEPLLGGKKIALFGSYGWGDGQWMRDWQARAAAAGAFVCSEPLIVNEMPDDDALAQCAALGETLAGS